MPHTTLFHSFLMASGYSFSSQENYTSYFLYQLATATGILCNKQPQNTAVSIFSYSWVCGVAFMSFILLLGPIASLGMLCSWHGQGEGAGWTHTGLSKLKSETGPLPRPFVYQWPSQVRWPSQRQGVGTQTRWWAKVKVGSFSLLQFPGEHALELALSISGFPCFNVWALLERGKSFDFQSSGHLLGAASGSLWGRRARTQCRSCLLPKTLPSALPRCSKVHEREHSVMDGVCFRLFTMKTALSVFSGCKYSSSEANG